MNPTRQTKLHDLESLRQSNLRQDNLPHEQQAQERLQNLLAFVRQLADTPNGQIELERRRRMFGDCRQRVDESEREFYGRLRIWLDRDLQSPSVG